jgi:hypothetical protein
MIANKENILKDVQSPNCQMYQNNVNLKAVLDGKDSAIKRLQVNNFDKQFTKIYSFFYRC